MITSITYKSTTINIKVYLYSLTLEWAGIGTTSIYTGLKNLEKKGLVKSRMDLLKTTKGPVGKLYSLKDSGNKILKEELHKGLSGTREHDKRFKIAVSGMDCLQKQEICDLLAMRIQFLKNEFKRLSKTYKDQQAEMVFKAEVLFDHSLEAIKNEINFTNQLIAKLNQKEEIQ